MRWQVDVQSSSMLGRRHTSLKTSGAWAHQLTLSIIVFRSTFRRWYINSFSPQNNHALNGMVLRSFESTTGNRQRVHGLAPNTVIPQNLSLSPIHMFFVRMGDALFCELWSCLPPSVIPLLLNLISWWWIQRWRRNLSIAGEWTSRHIFLYRCVKKQFARTRKK